MQDSTLIKIRRVSAYVAGVALAVFGIMGLLSEFSEAKPSVRNIYGYGLGVLIIASGVFICVATRSHVRPVSAFMAGGALLFLGILGLLIEFNNAKPSATNFVGYVLGVVFVVSGLLTCVAARVNYGGGLWSFVGLVCVAATIGRLASLAQLYMQNRHLVSPINFFLTTAGLWGVGCYCLFWGHMRRHKEKENFFP